MQDPFEMNKFTYKDYLEYPENERFEIIDGKVYLQAAPSWQHQKILRELILQFGNYLKDKSCQVFSAPFDLILPEENQDNIEDAKIVLQPDIVVICDKSKLVKTGYYGVPLMVIEILSPSSARLDRFIKFNLYEKFGVKEYWIVEVDAKLLSVFKLQDNNMFGRPEIYCESDVVEVSVISGLKIDLWDVFEGV